MNSVEKSFFLRLLLSLSSGVALIFAFPPFDFWPLAFIGFIPLLFSSSESSKQNFFLGAAAGFVFYSVSFFWLFNLAGYFYLLLSLYLSLFWGLFLSLLFLLPSKGRIFTGAFIWFFMEIIVSQLFTGFPWLLLGLSQWQNYHLLKIAAVFGIYGISFSIVLANLVLFHLFRKKYLLSTFAAAVTFALIVVVPAGISRKTEFVGTIDAMVVQPNVISAQQREAKEVFSVLKELTLENLKIYEPDIIIWPEGSFSADIGRHPHLLNDIKLLSQKHRCGILLGTFSRAENNLFYNSALLVEPETVRLYNKNRLAPYGEFIPGGRNRVVRDIFENKAGYIPAIKHGDKSEVFIMDGSAVAPLICFENIFPGMVRKLNGRGAELFIVITNDSWFGRFLGPYQHFAHNTLRAAESGKYFVQCSLTGISGVISPEGRVIKTVKKQESEIFVAGSLFFSVPLIKGETLYSKFGDVPLFLAAVLFTGAILCGKQNH